MMSALEAERYLGVRAGRADRLGLAGRRGRRTTGQGGRVQIEGLHEFLRDLGDADRSLRIEFNRIIRSVGAPIVADAQRRYYGAGGYERHTGKSLAGIKVATHFGGAVVSLGGGRLRYLLGQEWGSFQYPQFGEPRGRWHAASDDEAGTFFWPAWRAGVDDATDKVAAAVTRARDTIAGRNRGAARLAGRLEVLR